MAAKGFNWASAKFLSVCADSRFAKPRIFFWEGFNFVCAKPPLRRAESRFAEPRFLLLGKDLILLVRSRHCSELNRGLQNLDSPCKGTILFFSLVRKEPKVPQRFANLWTPGTIQISARYVILAEMTGVHQVTGRVGHFNLPGYRR